jgi:diguanylate cyclase (GGDEF)-like protein/PAS domain S-box-containing protein
MKGNAWPSAPPRRARRAIAVLLAGLLAAMGARAEAVRRDFYFQTIGTEHGLAQNTVRAFLQDRTGFIWIGTASGLQQYDGYRFTTYDHANGTPGGPPEGPVSALAEDADGRLWIGTGGFGLLRRAPGSGVFERLRSDADAAVGHPADNVHALLFDARRGLWVGSDAGIALVDAGDGHTLRRLALAREGQRAVQVRQLLQTADGTLWVASSRGLLRLPPQAEALETVAAATIDDVHALLVARDGQLHVATTDGLYRIAADGAVQQVWPSATMHPVAITAMAEDAHGRLWLALPHEGVVVLDPADGTTRWLKPGSEVAGSMPDAVATSLTLDRSGLLWIGTMERGIVKVDPEGAAFTYVAERDPARPQTAANYVRAIREDAAGGLWIGTDGDGLKRYLRAENRFEHFGDLAISGLPNAPRDTPFVVTTFADAPRGGFWVGSNRGVGLFDPARRTLAFLPLDPRGIRGVPDADVRSLLAARDGSLWIGTAHAGLVRYSPADQRWQAWRREAADGVHGGLSDDRVLALLEDHAGRIWAGNLNGLNLIDPVQGSVRVFRNDPADPHSLVASLVRTLYETAEGELWIGTQAGLARLDALDDAGARFSRWLPRDGLPSGTVYAIASDRQGRLWLSSNRGIASLERDRSTFHSFTLADGLQGMEYNASACAVLRDGDLAFGGVGGLNLFSPRTIVRSRYAAPVVFTDVRVGNRDLPVPLAGSRLQMAMADRIVRFEFAALDFAAPERNRFAYQLEDFDEHWIEAGTRHEATYMNLPAGDYVFKVRASNHDGYWNDEPTTLRLQVSPPWWDSAPAKVAYLLLATVALLVGWRAQRRQRREEQAHHRDLEEREDRLRLALWGSGDDFWDWNVARGTIVMTGSGDLFKGGARRPVELPYTWFREHLHPDDLPLVERRLEQHIHRVTETFESEHRLRNQRNEWVWSLVRGKIVERDADGQPLRLCGTARDVTAERAAEHDRRIAQEVIRSMSEAVAVTDLEFRFLSVNPAFTKMTGWRQDEVAGHSVALINCAQHAADDYLAVRDELVRSGHWRGEMWQRRKDGDEFLAWIEVSEVRDGSGMRTHFVSVTTDITDRKRTEQELRYLANYDALTGLPNRTLLSERIGHAIIRARRGARKVAVLFLDLDRFKHVNDSMGHAAGDRMLKAAGSRLRQVVREGDAVARLGGDEFTVVLEEITSGIEAERVAEKIIAAFEEPLELDNGQEVVISPSIGISLYPEHGQVPTDLLKFADTAMYQAKEHGRKTYMVYTEAMDAAARLRATTVAALRKALERNELSLVYQPKLSLLDERITGVEALLRWRSGDLGDVAPGVFVPIAEETGQIIEIGNWVVAQACAQLARWRDAGMADITMSINISVAQLLRGDLIRRLCDVLAEHDIAPHQLELELTESMVMANAEQSITTLRRLKAIGVTLAIDDFGTGYSSLSYLKRLPIDTLKIDKEFVGDITTDPDDEAITATVIAMAHSLGLNVVAEGVERAEQLEYLREQDCDEVQGHWLSWPLPPEQCLEFLREHAQRRRATLGERG